MPFVEWLNTFFSLVFTKCHLITFVMSHVCEIHVMDTMGALYINANDCITQMSVKNITYTRN